MNTDFPITLQQAANLLNVSRAHVVHLLEAGQLAITNVGPLRRVQYQDVLAHRAKVDEKSRQAMQQLTEQAQALNMGYE